MLRTIEEVVNLLEQKEQNANNHYNKEFNRQYPSKETTASLKGQMMAYNDCIMLIKSSHLLDEDGQINMVKNLVKSMQDKGMNANEILKKLGII